MENQSLRNLTVFAGSRLVASGKEPEIREVLRDADSVGAAPLLIFEDETGRQVDLNLSATDTEDRAPSKLPTAAAPRSVGRPRLGVTAREVTLLPRHWEWLNQQSGGASAALRSMVDEARRQDHPARRIDAARETLYRFMTAMAGNAPRYEEALRALFSGKVDTFIDATAGWDVDIRAYLWRTIPAAFEMPSEVLEPVPPAKRHAVFRAIRSAFGEAAIGSAQPLTRGPSGAGVFRIEVGGEDYLLRVEGPSDGFRDPVRHYACLKIAADAGVAPRLLLADPENSVAITDFVRTHSAPSGAASNRLLEAVVESVKTLHKAPLFAGLVEYLDGVEILMGRCETTGTLSAEVFERIRPALRALTVACRLQGTGLVSSHNDLHPGNVVFDGERAWLIDWEAAFAADAFVDLAAIANFFATNERERDWLLHRYLGREATQTEKARLFLMRQANRLCYLMVILNFVAAQPGAKLTLADSMRNQSGTTEGRDELAGGNWLKSAGELLAKLLHDLDSPRFAEAMATLREAHEQVSSE